MRIDFRLNAVCFPMRIGLRLNVVCFLFKRLIWYPSNWKAHLFYAIICRWILSLIGRWKTVAGREDISVRTSWWNIRIFSCIFPLAVKLSHIIANEMFCWIQCFMSVDYAYFSVRINILVLKFDTLYSHKCVFSYFKMTRSDISHLKETCKGTWKRDDSAGCLHHRCTFWRRICFWDLQRHRYEQSCKLPSIFIVIFSCRHVHWSLLKVLQIGKQSPFLPCLKMLFVAYLLCKLLVWNQTRALLISSMRSLSVEYFQRSKICESTAK